MSKYLQIAEYNSDDSDDDNDDYVDGHKKNIMNILQINNKDSGDEEEDETNDTIQPQNVVKSVGIQFVSKTEVNNRKKQTNYIKTQFEKRLTVLKAKGKYLENLHRTKEYIEENINTLWKNQLKVRKEKFASKEQELIEKKNFKALMLDSIDDIVKTSRQNDCHSKL